MNHIQKRKREQHTDYFPWEKNNTNLSLIDGNPVCCGEPLVILYVIDTILQVPKSLCQVNLKQVPQQILEVGAKVRGKSNLQNCKNT